VTNIPADDENQSPDQHLPQNLSNEKTIQQLSDALFDARRKHDELLRTAKAHFKRLIDLIEQFEPLVLQGFTEETSTEKGIHYAQSMMKELNRILIVEGIEKHSLEPGGIYEPGYYRVIAVEEDAEMPDRTILRVHRPAYLWRNELLRKGEVIVSRQVSQE